MSDVLILDATAQLDALATRRVSARELLAAAVARTDARNGAINAVVARDLGRAFADAGRIDAERVAGAAMGPLAGLPLTVKDTLDVEGLPASAGMASLLGRKACDADVVAALRAAGAIVWGKTNTPVKAADWQTTNALYGTTNNPYDTARTPGGSSGGSAAALAAGFTALEIGADIGGSLRIPASFCGVFAHKPTFGLVSQRGLVPPPDSTSDIDLAVVGPMARSARDLSLLLSVIAPVTPAPAEQVKGLRVALWLEASSFVLDTPVRDVVRDFAHRLEAEGAIVVPVAPPVDTDRVLDAYTMLLYAILGADLPAPLRLLYEAARPLARMARRGGADALSWAQALIGHTARPAEWQAADAARADLGRQMAVFFESFDVLLCPVAPVPAFRHDHSPIVARKLALSDGRRIGYRELMRWVALASLCGLPATAMPAGRTAEGLPVGIQLIGPRGGDARLLAIAQAFEDVCGGFIPPPAGRSPQ